MTSLLITTPADGSYSSLATAPVACAVLWTATAARAIFSYTMTAHTLSMLYAIARASVPHKGGSVKNS